MVVVVTRPAVPYLAGSLLFAHCVEVLMRHVPVAPGLCACGLLGCASRRHALAVIDAAGVDPETLTAADAHPRPWHERPVRPVDGSPAPSPDLDRPQAHPPGRWGRPATDPPGGAPSVGGGWPNTAPAAARPDAVWPPPNLGSRW